MELFNAALVIVGIIQLITLIVFFVMASNVAEIKRMLKPKSASDLIDLAEEEKYLGNVSLSKEYYLRAKYKYENEDKHTVKTQINVGAQFGVAPVARVETQVTQLNKSKIEEIEEIISKL